MSVDQLTDAELFERIDEQACVEELVKRYEGLARSLARKFSGRGAEVDDLEQVARMALFKAAGRFDPERGFRFTTFASRTMVGEIKHFFRDTAWSMRVPRSLQELYLRTSRATEELSHDLGRMPTVREIADVLDVDEDDVLEALDAGGALGPASLDSPMTAETDATVGDMIGSPDTRLAGAPDWLDLEPAFAQLDDRERTILRMRFFEGRTQSEIAEAVGVSQVHVSRLLRGALDKVRSTVEAS